VSTQNNNYPPIGLLRQTSVFF